MDYSIQNNEQLSERYSWPVGAGDPDSDAPRLLVSDERFHYVKWIPKDIERLWTRVVRNGSAIALGIGCPVASGSTGR